MVGSGPWMSIMLYKGDIRSYLADWTPAPPLPGVGWLGSSRSLAFLHRRRPGGHVRVVLTKRAQTAMFSGRTGCSQAGCPGSQVCTSRYSHQVCAETDAVLR